MSLDANPLVRDWLRPGDGGRLLVRTGKVDIGQRISTALLRIAATELSIPPSRIDVDPVRTGLSPDEGITSGSNSIEQSGRALRLAAATLRRAALALAADRLGVPPAELALGDGTVTHRATNRGIDLTGLMRELPADLAVDPDAAPLAPDMAAPLPDLPPRGLREMAEGRFVYVHDLDRPGMLHARVIRPPHPAARLRGFDTVVADRLSEKGLQIVHDGSFLAVAGTGEWAVVQAAERLARACDWDPGDGMPEGDAFALLREATPLRLTVVDGMPDRAADVPPPLPAPDLEATFERPYTLHGALAPSAAMAEWRDGLLTVHSHSQGIYPLRASIAESLGLKPDQVVIEHVPGSGCYGHNGADDAAFDAALVAMAVPGVPVLLKWSRADEHGWEPVAPAMTVTVAASIGPAHEVTAFSVEALSDTHRGRPRPGPDRAGPSRLLANRFRADPVPPRPATPNMGRHAGIHRNLDPVYAFPKKRLVKALAAGQPLRTSAMRCLGAAANVFAIESAMDILGRRAEADPVEYRRRHLTDPRATAVLGALRDRLPPRPDGAGRGIAYAQYKNAMTRVGIAVDLEVTDAAEVRLLEVVLVADAGRIVDRDGLAAQLEGGFLQAASWALHEEVRWDRDGVLTRDWDSYPVLRFDNVPRIAVVLLDLPGEPSVGAGEAAPGPALAAIANAIHDATGLRLTRLPFSPDAIRRAAAS